MHICLYPLRHCSPAPRPGASDQCLRSVSAPYARFSARLPLRVMASSRSQIIRAPSNAVAEGVKSVFLAGAISKAEARDWREELCAALADAPITIYNPHRPDWDGSWREDINFAPYREQVEWELEKQDQADIVVVFFHPDTQAPISLLELGLCARVPGKAIVCCPEGYWKRGNVQVVCKKLEIEMVEEVSGLKDAILKRLSLGS